MELWHVVFALISAALHAGWNAAVKASPRPAEMLTAQMALAALIVAPGLFWTGLPRSEAWVWIAASTSINLVVSIGLLKAFEYAGFGTGYPMVRAVAVLGVVPLSTLATGEALSWYGLAGVALIAGSLLALVTASRGAHAVSPKALAWIMLTGLALSAYILSDAKGVRASGSPWAYGFVVSITNALVMLVRQARLGVAPLQLLGQHWRRALPVAVASVTSYQLILLVWASAPIAPSAALRDTSALFAIFIAVLWLKEPFTRTQVAAVTMAAAAVPLLRFA